MGFSLGESGDYPMVVVCRLLIVAASLVEEHELSGAWASVIAVLGSAVQAQQLWCTGLIAPWYVGSSPTRDGTHISCIGRQILYYRATMEAQIYFHMFKGHLQFFCAQLCPTPCNPMDCSMSGSSIHGIFCEPSFHSLSNKIYFYKKLF